MISKMTTCQAVRQLRTVSGLSQQAFATRFGMSVRAIANYEKDRNPNKQALFKFAAYARELRSPELADIFNGRLNQELNTPEHLIGNPERFAAWVLASFHGKDWLDELYEKELAKLAKKIKASPKEVRMVDPRLYGSHAGFESQGMIKAIGDALDDIRRERAK
jgi:transcriptional regulator with XRE-family HTH domain